MGPLRALVAIQLAVLVVAGLATVVSMPRFTGDEAAHFSYVQSLAEDGRIPLLGRDLISEEAQAIYEGRPGEAPRADRAARGLAGRSYEAFQPPLYHLVAAPVFLLAGEPADLTTLRLLRLLGFAFLLACAGLLALLAWRVRPDGDPLALYAAGLTVLLWPGTVVRAVAVSNQGLEMVFGLALAIGLWEAWRHRAPRWVLGTALLLGLGLMTRLTLVAFAPSLAIVLVRALRARRLAAGRAAALTAATGALVVLPLAPWLAANVERYGSLTASAEVRAMQEPYLNPTGKEFGFADLPRGAGTLSRAVIAEEWWVEFLSLPKRLAGYAFAGAFLALGLAGLARAGRGRRRALGAVLALPVAAAVVWMLWALFVSNWDFLLPRYLLPELLGFGVLAALGARSLLGSDRRLAWCAAALTAGIAALWAHLATVEPFTG